MDLNKIWKLLFNFGLDTDDIAEGISSLFSMKETTGEDGKVVVEYDGNLASLADFPIIGDVLKAFASFTPPPMDTTV